eukprot:UN10628
MYFSIPAQPSNSLYTYSFVNKFCTGTALTNSALCWKAKYD